MTKSRRVGAKPEILETCDVIVFCVPDADVGSVSERVRSSLSKCARVFLHTSGVLSSDALAESSIISRGSMHPYQTFASQNPLPPLAGIWFGIEGEPKACRIARRLVKILKAHAVPIPTGSKTPYHLGAVVISNFLVALHHMTARLYSSLGFSENKTLDLVAPIVRQTLENMTRMGIAPSLTGPARRGDIETLERHAKYLREHFPEMANMYDALSNYCKEEVSPRKSRP